MIELRNGRVASNPTSVTEQILVGVPDLTYLGRVTLGPMSFRPQISADGGVRLPQRDDHALVAIDSDGGELWLVDWSRADATTVTSGSIAKIEESLVGAPIPWLVATIPSGYLEFDGQTISDPPYPRLYELFGASLPDLRDKFLMGNSGTHSVGSTGGVDSVTLTAAQSGMPDHDHHMTSANFGGGPPELYNSGGKYYVLGSGGAGGTAVLGGLVAGGYYYGIGVGSVVNGAKNAANSHENKPPYLAVKWITIAG